jgi:cytoskeletal protein RodZ
VTSTSVPPVSVPPTTKPPTSKGPKVGASTTVKTKPGPHGAAVTPSTVPTPPTASKTPIIPATSPTAPTAKIVNKTAQQDVDLTAREALRRMGGDIRTARKPGQKLLSADGSKAMAEAVTKGIKGSRNLKMLAVGSALGLGGYTANRLANRNDTSDLRG